MHKIFLFFIIIFLFSGCSSGLTWKKPLQEKKAAKSDYQRCLEDNPGNTAKCNDLKETYQDKTRSFKGQSQDPIHGGHRYDR